MRSRQTRATHWQARLRLLRGGEAAQLLEFALVLPVLVVLVVGAADFGAAWTLKDKLANAARDGARISASQIYDLNSGANPPASVTAARDAVANYLTGANVTSCTVGTSASSPPGTTFTWQYTSSSTGCGNFLLKIERGTTFQYTFNAVTTTATATRVTLNYPFNWNFGHVIKLMAPSSSYANSVTLSSNAVVPNLNQ